MNTQKRAAKDQQSKRSNKPKESLEKSKDRSPVITTYSTILHSNNSSALNSTSTNSSARRSVSSATSNNNNRNIIQSLRNVFRFRMGGRGSNRLNNRNDSNCRTSSRFGKNPLNASVNENTPPTHFVQDESMGSVAYSADDQTVNFVSSTSFHAQFSNDLSSLHTCALCCHEYTSDQFEILTLCSHAYCQNCLRSYLKLEITESRITLNCPQTGCPERIHPCDITRILQNEPDLINKYERFMVRRVLQSMPDTRWCPAPDCGFAVIASGYAACPEIRCLRPGCNTSFCYHCKAVWHPNKTCEDAAREKSSGRARFGSYIGLASAQKSKEDQIKQCPRCHASVLKMDDGSCNHMTCSICTAEFCWLCGREISDLHYLSPSGCTFWGKKQWSRKKVILWQIATLIGAPVIIALAAGVTIPGIIIGFPIWAGRKIHKKLIRSTMGETKKTILVALGVVGSVIVSPIIAALAVGIGVPILLAYVYGVIPISLCRTGGCGISKRDEMSDEDVLNIDNLLPFSSREIPIAQIIPNDNQSVISQPTVGTDSASLSNSVVHLVDERPSPTKKVANQTFAGVTLETLPSSQYVEVQIETGDRKNSDIESINISEKSSKTLDSLKVLAGSIKGACAVSGIEVTADHVDGHARKGSSLSNASDYSRSIQSEAGSTMYNRAGSPHSGKTISFIDERNRSKSKNSTERF